MNFLSPVSLETSCEFITEHSEKCEGHQKLTGRRARIIFGVFPSLWQRDWISPCTSMTTLQVLLIIISCLNWPKLCLAQIIEQDFYFPNFVAADDTWENFMSLLFNGAAFINPDCSCIWLTNPPNGNWGGTVKEDYLIFYDNDLWTATNSTPPVELRSLESSTQSFHPRETIRKANVIEDVPVGNLALLQSSPPPPPPAPPPPPFPPPPRPVNSVVSFYFNFEFMLQSRSGTASTGSGLVFLLTDDWDNYVNPGDQQSFFGVFPSLGGKTKFNIWAVEFDTHKDLVVNDIDNNHVGMNLNSARSYKSRSAQDIGLTLYGVPINVWIEYNYPSRVLTVRLDNKGRDARPAEPFISLTNYELPLYIKPHMYPGFAARGVDQQHIINYFAAKLTTDTPSLETLAAMNASVPPVVIFPPPPPELPPGFTIPWLGIRIQYGTLAMFAGWLLMLTLILLVLRNTRCGQRKLWQLYGACKCCHRLCGLKPCLYCCTLPLDAQGLPRKNAGQLPKAKVGLKKTGKGKGVKAKVGKKPIVGKGKKATAVKGKKKPTAGKGKTPTAGKGKKPTGVEGKTPAKGKVKTLKKGPATKPKK